MQDKGIFYHRASLAGLPVPELFAIWHADLPGWRPGGRSLDGPEDWEGFFLRSLPGEFVIKPSLGYHGREVRILTRVDGRLEGEDGSSVSVDDLVDTLSRSSFDTFVVQERVRNHEALRSLSDTDYLQTVRIMTLVHRDGSVELLEALLKVIVGSNRTDNYRGGAVGNLLAPIELEGGVLGPAVTSQPNGETTAHRRHPATGHRIDGQKLPHWRRASTLARDAAAAFSQVRTVGWDVALTPDGPVLVEANPWWDPPNPLGEMPRILEVLSEA